MIAARGRATRAARLLAGIIGLAASGPGVARAEIDLKFGGMITSDIRFRLLGNEVPSSYPEQYKLLANGFSRNENLIKSQLTLRIGEKVKAVGDVDLYLYGYSDVKDIDSLLLRERVDPYRLEVTSAYIDIYKLLPGLDLRIGRQVVVWGTADQFNPTNNINSLDFSDPLLFGKALGNNMVRLDYNIAGDWNITGVLVPIFRPSQLPRSAPIALLDPYRPLSVQERFVAENTYYLGTTIYVPQTIRAYTVTPEPSIENMQWGLRVAGRLLDQDVSLSWYHGRFSFPVPMSADFHSAEKSVDVGVTWPRMDVLGLDIGGSIEKLGGMGYWIEGAVIFPQEVNYSIYTNSSDLNRTEVHIPNIQDGAPYQAAVDFKTGKQLDNPYFKDLGKYFNDIPRWPINTTTPFFKMTMGGDMSIGSHVYVNVQYVHGFFDEFGAGWAFHQSREVKDRDKTSIWQNRRIGDYLIAVVELKFLSETVFLRVAGTLKLPSLYFDSITEPHFDEYRATGVLFPQLSWKVWDGTEIALGAVLFFGDRSTKFGDPATGASEVFLKAKFAY